MNKKTLLLTSLVTAVPGAVLGLLMVNFFLSYAGGDSVTGVQTAVPTMFYVMAGLGLVASASVVLLPAGIVVLGPKDPSRASSKKDQEEKEDDAADSDELAVAEADAETLDSGEMDLDDPETADELVLADTGDFESFDESFDDSNATPRGTSQGTVEINEEDFLAELESEEFELYDDEDEKKNS